jgi:uncharacterized damage-inducible protein DinB
MSRQAAIASSYVLTMAQYNAWQNGNIYETASQLTDAQRHENRGAFFNSISRTLNHILWADQVWLHRLTGSAKPAATSIAAGLVQFEVWSDLKFARTATDDQIEQWARALTESDFKGDLTWLSGATGKDMVTSRSIAMVHLFNHQTHHRGQVHAMLTGFGLKPSVTDLPFAPFL